MISNLPLAITVSLHRLLEDVSWGSQQIKEQGYERDGDRFIFDCGARSFVMKFVRLCRNRERGCIDKWSFNRSQLKQSKEG